MLIGSTHLAIFGQNVAILVKYHVANQGLVYAVVTHKRNGEFLTVYQVHPKLCSLHGLLRGKRNPAHAGFGMVYMDD